MEIRVTSLLKYIKDCAELHIDGSFNTPWIKKQDETDDGLVHMNKLNSSLILEPTRQKNAWGFLWPNMGICNPKWEPQIEIWHNRK